MQQVVTKDKRLWFARQSILSYVIAAVWLYMGLWCKLIMHLPRHEELMGRVFGVADPAFITQVIGVIETAIAVWICSGKYSRCCAIVQILLIASMNITEFLRVPDLLLFGKRNAIIAGILILLIIYNEWFLRRKRPPPAS